MVNVYRMNTKNLIDPIETPEIVKTLPEYRRKKILAHGTSSGRIESLGAGLLLKEVLMRHGCSDDGIVIGEHGKPEVKNLYFNLSHSDNMVICAVSDKTVGCDIERIQTAPKRIAKRFFHENEIEYLERFDEHRKNEEFYRLWTIKESYLKMTGYGLTFPLKDFEVRIIDGIRIYKNHMLQDCYINEYALEGYKVAVCSEDETFADELEVIESI